MSNEKMLEDIYKEIHGNGQPGLKERVTRLDETVKAMSGTLAEIRDAIKKSVKWVLCALIVLAVAAGSSPFAEKLAEKFLGFAK